MNASALASGQLFVVATPIGNLGDVSERARSVLAGCDLVAAEDTRRTGQLLSHLGIRRPLVSLFAHNETRRTEELLERLGAGAQVALVSDAGTPLVSDPGAHLVRAAVAAGIDVVPVPGPSAVLAALCGSGFDVDRFVFEGFLPRRGGERRRRLEALRHETRAVVLYESPKRLAATLDDLRAVFGGSRRIAVARELTKLHEEFVRDTLDGLLGDDARLQRLGRGEIVLVLEGASTAPAPLRLDLAPLLDALLEVLPPARVARLLAATTGEDRKTLYAQISARRRPASDAD